jgi:CrcB protein
MRATITLSPKQLTFAVLAVAGGGGVGTLLRDLFLKLENTAFLTGWVGSAPHTPGGSWTGLIPWVLLVINVVGVYTATRLLRGPLKQHDPNDPMRLLMITGFFGGFTSYSSLFADLALIWHRSIGASVFVAAIALLSGVFAAWLGLGRKRR